MPPSLPKVQKGREPAHVLLPNQLGLEPTERVFSTSLPSASMRFLAIFKFWGATRMGKTWGHPFLTPTSLEAPTPTDFGLMARLLVRQTFLFTLVFVSFPLFFLYFWGGGWGARSAISHCHISYTIISHVFFSLFLGRRLGGQVCHIPLSYHIISYQKTTTTNDGQL